MSIRSRLFGQHIVLIATTGKVPTTLTLRPFPILVTLLVAGAIPIAWISTLLYRNIQLSQRNQALTDTANEVLVELDSLDSEINDLRERAGLSASEETLRDVDYLPPQGGVAIAVAPETLFDLAQAKMPSLDSALDAQVRPALEAKLAAEAEREAAFPSGKPLQGDLKVSSRFGLRHNPFGGSNYEIHEGLDFSGPVGQPIYATAEGTVETAMNGNGYGNHVIIDHGYGYETLYAHMSDLAVDAGDQVQRGDLVGYLGNTGRSSGPHLHYGIYRQGKAVNPQYYLKLSDSEG